MRRDRRVKNFLESEIVKRAYSPDEYVWATLNRNPKCPGPASLPGAQIFDVFYQRAQQSEALEGGSTDFWPPAADPSSSKENGLKNISQNSLLF